MFEQIASYYDGSGTYLVTRDRDILNTLINDAELIEERLTRLPEWDAVEHDDWVLTDRFACTPDGPGGKTVVWIDGDAYLAELLPKR
ncbi:hypothetical protein [Agromyces humi]|uniref:hypothetical protein n=1 Tax=Agromyces humi TaxID=1766800 RepID=UPI00135C8A3C|nr:hypothetical protein [Agromyces humi]